MGLYDRILVPTDGSPGMGRVIDHAAALARAHDAEIHAIYVVDATGFAGMPMETSWDNVRRLLEADGETALAEVESRVGGNVRVQTATVEGTPSGEIVRYASEHGMDVVVMGTHGRGGINRLLVGSVAERVVRSSHVPVLTVRVNGERDPGGDTQAGAETERETQTESDADETVTEAPGPGHS